MWIAAEVLIVRGEGLLQSYWWRRNQLHSFSWFAWATWWTSSELTVTRVFVLLCYMNARGNLTRSTCILYAKQRRAWRNSQKREQAIPRTVQHELNFPIFYCACFTAAVIFLHIQVKLLLELFEAHKMLLMLLWKPPF